MPFTASNFEDQTADAWPEENGDESSPPEDHYDQGKQTWKKTGKIEPYVMTEDKIKKPNDQIKWKDLPKPESKTSRSDDDLTALLQVILLENGFHMYTTYILLIFKLKHIHNFRKRRTL